MTKPEGARRGAHRRSCPDGQSSVQQTDTREIHRRFAFAAIGGRTDGRSSGQGPHGGAPLRAGTPPAKPNTSSCVCYQFIFVAAVCVLKRRKRRKGGRPVYSRQHLLFFFFLTCSAARVAVSNTSRTPSLLLAEHSR